MTERIRIDETSHPVDIKVRRIMKGDYLKTLDEVADGHSGKIPKQYGLVVYGSTVMRQLAQQERAEFKFGGIKSSDIDIGGYITGQPDRNTTNKDEFFGMFAPILAETTYKAGFDLWKPKLNSAGDSAGMINQKYNNNELETLAKAEFTGDYYVARKFTRTEIVELLQSDPDYDKIESYIIDHFSTKGREFKTICIAISAHTEHFPSMMEPTILFGKTEFDNLRIENPRYHNDLPLVGRARRLDMLAGKLARCIGQAFKPTDLVDIYNLVTGPCRPSGEFGTTKAVDDTDVIDMEVVRLLTINYLICAYGNFSYDSTELLKNFENTPENMRKATAKLKTQIIEYKQDELFKALPEIYAVVKDFVSKVFKVKTQGMKFGPLNLTMGEVNYVNGFYGAAPKKAIEVQPKQTWVEWALRKTPPVRTEFTPVGECGFGIKIDQLRENYPLVLGFAHPKMDAAIKSNTLLNQKLQHNQYGVQSNEMTGDF